jgi:hypothetical protein
MDSIVCPLIAWSNAFEERSGLYKGPLNALSSCSWVDWSTNWTERGLGL